MEPEEQAYPTPYAPEGQYPPQQYPAAPQPQWYPQQPYPAAPVGVQPPPATGPCPTGQYAPPPAGEREYETKLLTISSEIIVRLPLR